MTIYSIALLAGRFTSKMVDTGKRTLDHRHLGNPNPVTA
jgi:hypothetical protein